MLRVRVWAWHSNFFVLLWRDTHSGAGGPISFGDALLNILIVTVIDAILVKVVRRTFSSIPSAKLYIRALRSAARAWPLGRSFCHPTCRVDPLTLKRLLPL